MHSGWGVLVAVSGGAGSVEVVDRRRIVVMDPKIPGAKQPYHHAANIDRAAAERYLADCAAASERAALAAVGEGVQSLAARQFRIVGAAVLLASGRALPDLARILESHALIHTAEGEFFRDAVRKACERLEIPVTAIRERELDERATVVFGNGARRVQHRIAGQGRSIGPPWTKDHKSAALAASITLCKTVNAPN